MVVTLAPSTCQAKTVQDFTALPSTCTTQAPHCEVSQPTWVPVSRRCSRRYCTSSVRGSTSPVTGFPFTVIATADMVSSSKSSRKAWFFAAMGDAIDDLGQNPADLDIFRSANGLHWQPHANAVVGRKGFFRILANLPWASERPGGGPGLGRRAKGNFRNSAGRLLSPDARPYGHSLPDFIAPCLPTKARAR